MPLFSKLTRHLKSPKHRTTTATPGKEPPQTPNTEAIAALSGHAQILLASLRDVRTDFYLIYYNIRLFSPVTRETRSLSKAPYRDPRLWADSEEWAATQKVIPIVRRELARARERFWEKRALVEAAVREEWKLRDTVIAGIGEGAGAAVDTGFLEEVLEMEGRIQECRVVCQTLAAEDRKVRALFADLERYQGLLGGRDIADGVDGGEWVYERSPAGESSAVGALLE